MEIVLCIMTMKWIPFSVSWQHLTRANLGELVTILKALPCVDLLAQPSYPHLCYLNQLLRASYRKAIPHQVVQRSIILGLYFAVCSSVEFELKVHIAGGGDDCEVIRNVVV